MFSSVRTAKLYLILFLIWWFLLFLSWLLLRLVCLTWIWFYYFLCSLTSAYPQVYFFYWHVSSICSLFQKGNLQVLNSYLSFIFMYIFSFSNAIHLSSAPTLVPAPTPIRSGSQGMAQSSWPQKRWTDWVIPCLENSVSMAEKLGVCW